MTRYERRHEQLKNTPIIAVTAHASNDARKKAIAAGCDAYLAKPLDAHDLRAAVNRLLQSEPPTSPTFDEADFARVFDRLPSSSS